MCGGGGGGLLPLSLRRCPCCVQDPRILGDGPADDGDGWRVAGSELFDRHPVADGNGATSAGSALALSFYEAAACGALATSGTSSTSLSGAHHRSGSLREGLSGRSGTDDGASTSQWPSWQLGAGGLPSASAFDEAQPNLAAYCDKLGALLRVGVRARYKNVIVEVLFVGRTHFASGVWAGVQVLMAAPKHESKNRPGAVPIVDYNSMSNKEQNDAKQTAKLVGKHDGKLNAMRYFRCPPRTGIFVRPMQLVRLY
jgi:hypothetical protein|eukprot:COSAG01_NODE_2821_length_7011_cov_2.363571_2_plen_255_part_00